MNQLVIKCTMNRKELFWFGFTQFWRETRFHQDRLASSIKGSQSLSASRVSLSPLRAEKTEKGKCLLYRIVGIYRPDHSSEKAEDINCTETGSNCADRWGGEEEGNYKTWKLRYCWKGRCSLPAHEPKDICLPCLSTERGRRCGEPRRFLSRYTLSTSPWCRVVLLVSNPDDWKGVWQRHTKW